MSSSPAKARVFIRTSKAAAHAIGRRRHQCARHEPLEERGCETYDPLLEVPDVWTTASSPRLHEAQSVLELYSLDGGVRGTIQLPGAAA